MISTFKKDDRVVLYYVDSSDIFLGYKPGIKGTILEDDKETPYVRFDDGRKECFVWFQLKLSVE